LIGALAATKGPVTIVGNGERDCLNEWPMLLSQAFQS
jgi:hypothetical protein